MSQGSPGAHFEQVAFADRSTSDAHALRAPSNTRRRIADRVQLPLPQLSTRVSFLRDQTIFAEGEKCRHLYMVVSGAARICSYMPDGERQITRFAFPNDYFGLILEPTYSNTVEAASDLEVLRSSLPALLSLADRTPSLRIQVLALLWRQLRLTQNHVLMLGRQSALERVAMFLVLLHQSIGRNSPEPFKIPMSRRDIADYVGLAIETICRILRGLERNGVIDLPNRHQLVVRNIDAIRTMAGSSPLDARN